MLQQYLFTGTDKDGYRRSTVLMVTDKKDITRIKKILKEKGLKSIKAYNQLQRGL